MGQSLKCCNVYIRVDICLLFWTSIQDNVDWRGNHHLENIERRLGTINRHPHLSPFSYRLSIQSLTDRVVKRVIEWNSVERRLLCQSKLPISQEFLSLSLYISLSRLYIYQTDGGWYMVKNGTTTTFSSKLMSAWATDQVPQRAGRVFFLFFFFLYLNLKELTVTLFYFLNCLCFVFCLTSSLNCRSNTHCWSPLMARANYNR